MERHSLIRTKHDHVMLGFQSPTRRDFAFNLLTISATKTNSFTSSHQPKIMSTTITPNDSPIAPMQPLHNPSQAAHVVVPQAPLGNVANQAPGMGAKALLAKKMAKNQCVSMVLMRIPMEADIISSNPTYISPTDNLMTPCTQKLSAAKKKHFIKY